MKRVSMKGAVRRLGRSTSGLRDGTRRRAARGSDVEFEWHDREIWVQHHPYDGVMAPLSSTDSLDVAAGNDDRSLVERIMAAYQRSMDADHYGEDSVWRLFRAGHADIHDAFVGTDPGAAAEVLRHPDRNTILYGYELFTVDSDFVSTPRWRQRHADRCQDMLTRLAEALAVVRLENPEGGAWGDNMRLSCEDVVARIERKLGVELPVRLVQTGFSGLAARDGVITERMVHAVYCAHRASRLVRGIAAPRVIEIGAGMGYTAHYAQQLGVRDYTIIDLPMTNAVQAYFLGRVLGEQHVELEGESGNGAGGEWAIKIKTPDHFFERVDAVDLVMNIDSLTELGKDLATRYMRRILDVSPRLLSVNHEANEYSVADLVAGTDTSVERFPYWLRNGYVEEIVERR